MNDSDQQVQSLGEFRVGIDFNPSNDSGVAGLKQKAAELINDIDAISTHDGEGARLKALAMTAVEDAAMWAVKAQTKPAFDARPGGPAA